jgi:hypothetical protein
MPLVRRLLRHGRRHPAARLGIWGRYCYRLFIPVQTPSKSDGVMAYRGVCRVMSVAAGHSLPVGLLPAASWYDCWQCLAFFYRSALHLRRPHTGCDLQSLLPPRQHPPQSLRIWYGPVTRRAAVVLVSETLNRCTAFIRHSDGRVVAGDRLSP